MEQTITVQVTDQGILIPDDLLGDLDAVELEIVREKGQIVIRPKQKPADERDRVDRVLRAAGLLYEPDWELPPPVPPEERARLAQKLASDPPLSQEILDGREDRV
jgi:virulence-associated protein VagC